jgi:hypothetical protein
MLGRLRFPKPAPEAPVELHAKSNCRRCYGRGVLGMKVGTEDQVLCACVFRQEAVRLREDAGWSDVVQARGSAR